MQRGFLSILESIIDIVLPLKPRSARTRERSVTDIQPVTGSHELLGIHITTIMEYRDQAVSDLIRSLKYERSNYAAQLAGAMLADYLREELSSLKTFSPIPILLVPMPLHISRLRERGFNQVEKVLKALPSEFRDGTLSRISSDALTRTRPTEQQTRLPRAERLKNVEGAFAADAEQIKNTQVILIDDVTTTGATLASATRALDASGARVTAIALARA